jgi:hypothetical protein
MSPRRPPLRLADLPHRLRAELAELPQLFREWREGFREDPAAFWHGPIPRIIGWTVFGALAIAAAFWVTRLVTPGGSAVFGEAATSSATVYVACTNPACRAAYSVRVPMDFDDWPMRCEECGQDTVYRARRCTKCRPPRWYATPPGSPDQCPFCAQADHSAEPRETPDVPSRRSDDDEDPWPD